jgi:hypothetical protein
MDLTVAVWLLPCTLSNQASYIADESSDDKLELCNKERSFDRYSVVGHENFVQVDRGNGDEPVGRHHGRDVH